MKEETPEVVPLPSSLLPSPSSILPPPLWPFLLLCALVAVLLDLGALHDHHHADSLLPVLVSQLRWTPFFWLQDRVGMLVPLLAMPVRDLFANLLVQGFLYLFSGLTAFFLLAHYVLRDRTYPLVATCSAAAFLALSPIDYRFDLFLNTFYGVWLALGLGGLVILEQRPGQGPGQGRVGLALVLLLLAHWVYSATAVVLGPLALFRGLLRHRQQDDRGRVALDAPRQARGFSRWLFQVTRSETVLTLFLLGLSFVAGLGFQKAAMLFPSPVTRTKMYAAAVDNWPLTWWLLTKHSWEALAPFAWPVFLALAVAVGLSLLTLPRVRRQAAPFLRAALVLVAAAVVFGLLVGTREWVRLNDCENRYYKPGVFLIQAALVILAVGPVCAAVCERTRRRLYLLTAPVLVMAALAGSGPPSIARVRAAVSPPAVVATTEAVVQHRCNYIAGNYWCVWPRVFHANMTLRERGEQRVVWGVTFRGQATCIHWDPAETAGMGVAIPRGDDEAGRYLSQFEFPPLQWVQDEPGARIFRPARSAGK
jgi:hypothetical protein